MAEENSLVTHARRELEVINEDPETIEKYLKVVQAFSDMGHSGGSVGVAVANLSRLFLYQNLKPLTDDPKEWSYISEDKWDGTQGIWQNIRNGEAFSSDGGKTYYLLSEGRANNGRITIRTSEKAS